MTSMLDAARSLITPELISNVSKQTGESETAVSQGMGAVIPLLLGTLARRSDESGLMNQVASLASRSVLSTGRDEHVLGTGGTSKAESATGWLSSLFGDGMSSLTSGIARYAGLKSSAVTSLFTMAGPLILGYLGRLMQSENLDANGLASKLQGQRKSLTAAIPSELDSLIPSFKRTGETARAATNDVSPVAAATRVPLPQQPRSSRNWVLPLVLGALALGGVLWWMGRTRPVEQVRTGITDAANRTVGTAGTVVDTLARTLPGNITLRVPRGGMEDRLMEYLGSSAAGGSSSAFNFDRIEFETGSASLTPASRAQITNIADILKAYPTAQISIAGHTDNVGDPVANLDLSRSRATVVMTMLNEMGVESTRIQAEGYGSQFPVADNSTDEGRARNRRVALEVTSR